jgi:hypothetical protein
VEAIPPDCPRETAVCRVVDGGVATVERDGWVRNVATPEERDAVERRLRDGSRGGNGSGDGRQS